MNFVTDKSAKIDGQSEDSGVITPIKSEPLLWLEHSGFGGLWVEWRLISHAPFTKRRICSIGNRTSRKWRQSLCSDGEKRRKSEDPLWLYLISECGLILWDEQKTCLRVQRAGIEAVLQLDEGILLMLRVAVRWVWRSFGVGQ